MSVFRDFQKAWALRFPICELPQAWEDDVRANLAKHKLKVADLREELEKEEFYVEYLEHLLADVERVKRKPSLSADDGCNQLNDENISELTKQSADSLNFRESGVLKLKREDPKEKFLLDGSNEKVENSGSGNAVLPPQCGSDQNSYVTVIEVSGSFYTAESSAESKEPQCAPVESEKNIPPFVQSDTNDSEVPPESPQQKKKPPAPPKKPRKSIPIQAVPPVKKALGALKLEETSEEGRGSQFNICASVSENRNSFSNHSHLVSSPSEQINKNDKISGENITQQNLQPDLLHTLVPDEKCSLNEKSEESSDLYLEENIYDTVAPDELELNSVANHGKTMMPVNREVSVEDSDGDYVTFPNEYLCETSQEGDFAPPLPSSESIPVVQKIQQDESPECATYMNLDFFLKENTKFSAASQEESTGADTDDEDAYLVQSFSSDQEIDAELTPESVSRQLDSTVAVSIGNDDVFELDSGVYSSSVESASFLCVAESSTPPTRKKNGNDMESNKGETERISMYKCILNSIIESETIYVDCINLLMQYMKALKSTIGTSQPLLSLDDFNTIFYRIPELHCLHNSFLKGLKSQIANWDGTNTVGEEFKILASKLGVYGSFLQNYSKSIETVRKCSDDNAKFSEITKSIKLKALQGQATTLEDLLHKPIARVQKNALVLHDLLRYTLEEHPDYKTLKTALKMTQCFLNDINVSASANMFPVADRAQRHLVKNSFIVELSEGHRKLRHLFLFSDVIVCAKYKPSTRQKFTFEVKWFIPLSEASFPDIEGEGDIKENSPYDILSLKSRASSMRDQILKEEKGSQGKEKTKIAGRSIDKYKKKLSELEAQLVLASPNLVFRVGQKSGKVYTFFLSSDFDKSQWIEAITILQTSAPASSLPISPYELQAWVTSCRKHFGTNLGSFLLRSGKDEDLLVGELHIYVKSLHGLSRPSDVYLCFEIDSYGHFFNKAKTKTCYNSLEPVFEQEFIIDLEGSQTLRILCYENHSEEGAILRGKGALELSQSWLTEKFQEKSISLQELMLIIGMKYVSAELSMRRIPSSKAAGVFGVKIQQVCKKEKSPVPFIVTSCIREVEKRGMHEVGIYRVSGSASDVQRLKRSFETNVYEAEQLLKEVDIHSVTGMFKMYLRELPEALFSDALYQKFFSAFNFGDQEEKKKQLLLLFDTLPEVNQGIIKYLLDHLVRINQYEGTNKMSLHNLATVFGPTLLRPGSRSSTSSSADLLTAGTFDVMAQAGIFYFFLKRHAAGLPLSYSSQE